MLDPELARTQAASEARSARCVELGGLAQTEQHQLLGFDPTERGQVEDLIELGFEFDGFDVLEQRAAEGFVQRDHGWVAGHGALAHADNQRITDRAACVSRCQLNL